MEQYLMDTNAISDYFSASFSDAGINFMDGVIDNIPNISVITQIELLCWKINKKTEGKIHDFISDSIILNISQKAITHCVNLRKYKKIKAPDAIIAATALSYDYTLITNNEKDFINIQ